MLNTWINILEMRKLSARWVPQMLIQEQKLKSVYIQTIL